jgi:hypothetical protein
MKKYDEYKDSGVAWIGEVPKHWEVIKLKYKYHFQTGATPNTGKKENFEGELKWANISDLNGSVVYDTTKHINKEAASKCSMNISPKGSLMYSFKLSVGTVAFCGEDMYTNEAIASFIPQKNDLKYLFYCAPIFIIHNANRNIYNAPLLNQELIKNALICLPSLNEQTAIATYLDTHCAKIDNLISIQQKRIALLQELKQSVITHAVTKGLNPNVEMKQSGVEWIGDVPKHWEVMPLKFTGTFGNGLTYSPKDVVDNGILVLRSSNIQNSSLSFEDNVYVSKVSRDLLVKKGDIIICSRNGSAALVGKSAFVDKELNATFGAFMMRYIPNIEKKYGFYLFQTAIGQYKGYFSTTTINQLTKTTIDEIKVPLAMAEEQAAIASYLDHKCATIDTSISNAQHQIELLQEYKQSLITEVVTGKRKVTDN